MSEQSQFVALRCESCGGKLDVPQQNVTETVEGCFIITGNDVFTCLHCGTEYLPKQSLERFVPPGGITISGGVVRIGTIVAGDTPDKVIHGDIVGGDIITGDKVVHEKIVVQLNPTDVPTSKDEENVTSVEETVVQEARTEKPWWQFWK